MWLHWICGFVESNTLDCGLNLESVTQLTGINSLGYTNENLDTNLQELKTFKIGRIKIWIEHEFLMWPQFSLV